MLGQYTVRPRPMFIGARQSVEEDESAWAMRKVAAVRARQQERQALQTLLGAPIYMRTIILPLSGGGYLGPAKDRRGFEMRFGLWSPHRRVLIDVFPRTLPSTEEMEDRAAWAERQSLRYALVRPGTRLTTESLRAWLEGES